MPFKNWCSIHARWSKSSLKHSIRSVAFFPSLKQNSIAYRSSKVSWRPDCIFEIHQLRQSGFSRVYSNCCCSCSFEAEIIKIGQSSHKMYSNYIVNFQESTTTLNASTKKVWKLIVILILLYILWDDWPIFMISGWNQQLQKELEYTLLKSDCHSWWISKQSDIFNLGKNDTETYGMLQTAFRPSCINRTSVFEWHKRFKEGTESGGMMRVVEIRKSEHQSWLAKGFGLGLLCWGFKGVQEEIPREEVSTLQIVSVTFPPEQYTSPQLHQCHRLFEQDGHQDSSSPSL